MRVTYYYPWGYFHPAHGGAATVAARHMAWFRAQGWQPRIVILGDERAPERADFERHYFWVDDIRVLTLRNFPIAHDIRDACDPIRLLKQHAAMCDAAEVQRVLGGPADLVFLNYFFSAPFLDLIPRNALRVLETHDIFFTDAARWELPPVTLQHHLRMELELYRLFDAAIMLNPDEAGLAQARGVGNATFIPQGVEPPCLVAPDQPVEPKYDLLFVGSAHGPNIEGADWFYRHVFQPHLKQHGLSWAVAGAVCDKLRFRDRQVRLLGRVDNLTAVYRASKIVVVPLFQGSGMSIKTLEAFAHGSAVVSTPAGLRGLHGCRHFADEIQFNLNPAGVAGRIMQLRNGATERAERGRHAVEYIRANFSISNYERRMTELFARLVSPRLPNRETPLLVA